MTGFTIFLRVRGLPPIAGPRRDRQEIRSARLKGTVRACKSMHTAIVHRKSLSATQVGDKRGAAREIYAQKCD
jgi:hypothetical protein